MDMLTTLRGAALIAAAGIIGVAGYSKLTGDSGAANAAGTPAQSPNPSTVSNPQPANPGRLPFFHRFGTSRFGTGMNESGVFGTVSKIVGNSITVTTLDGQSKTVTVSTSTQIRRAESSGTLSDIHMGDRIAALGAGSGSTLAATNIILMVPRAMGVVSAINGSTVSITPLSGPFKEAGTAVRSITLSSTTTFRQPGSTTAKASDLKVGAVIVAEGTISPDGKTMQAARVGVLPAGVPGIGGFGAHRLGGDPNAPLPGLPLPGAPGATSSSPNATA